MDSLLAERRIDLLRYALAAAMLGAGIYFVFASWHWAMLCDSPIMHYVNFLMDHGRKPYSEITDNNFPGSYLTESLAMHVFGPGDAAWRVYDFFLLIVLTLAMMVIAWPLDWVAGLFAGGMFLLIHGSEGPLLSVEREQVMTALMMVGYAALFSAVRLKRPWLMGVMGFTAGMAAAIKPTVAPLVVLLIGIAAAVLRRRQIAAGLYVVYGFVGVAAAASLSIGFLWEHRAFADFILTQRLITPFYVGLADPGRVEMVRRLMSPDTLALAGVALVLAVAHRHWDWERWSLALGAAVGLASYFMQHKGFLHHRYMFVTFLMLLAGIESLTALRRWGWPRRVGAAAIVATLVAIVPYYVLAIHRQVGGSDLLTALEGDLQRLGGTKELQGKVQCLDLVYGCVDALYHLQLVENTSFTGDMLIFSPTNGPAVQYHRAMWSELARRDPADVLVMTNEYFQGPNTYDKVNHWPEYARYLKANYVEVIERSFPYEHRRTPQSATEWGGPASYRIYIRKGSLLLAKSLGSGPHP